MDENLEVTGRKHHWTLAHGFYAAMGGFVIDTSPTPIVGSNTRFTLTPNGIRFLMKHRPELIPDLPEFSIQDRSKADWLAKGLLIIQLAYFCATCLARYQQSISLSLLEVTTAAHAICTAFTCLVWLKKPRDIGEPTVIRPRQIDNTTRNIGTDAACEENLTDLTSDDSLRVLVALLYMRARSIYRVTPQGLRFHPPEWDYIALSPSPSSTEDTSRDGDFTPTSPSVVQIPLQRSRSGEAASTGVLLRDPTTEGLRSVQGALRETSPPTLVEPPPQMTAIPSNSRAEEITTAWLKPGDLLRNTGFFIDPAKVCGRPVSRFHVRASKPWFFKKENGKNGFSMEKSDIARWELASRGVNAFAEWTAKDFEIQVPFVSDTRELNSTGIEEYPWQNTSRHIQVLPLVLIYVLPAIYGWSVRFPTEVEHSIWTAIVAVLGALLVLIFIIQYLESSKIIATTNPLFRFASWLLLFQELSFGICGLVFIVLSVRQVFILPDVAFDVPSFLKYWPHFC